ncbi:hypothetical protein HDE_01357 [Halotydeus destructor]|nr:hypothetical protein HDE_01357 [Halotydeus destructor]
MPKQVYGILLANSRKILKETCSTEGKEIFLQHVNQFCITDDKLNHFVEEVEKMTVMLNYVATNVSSEEVIPWTCCAYFKAYEKIERQIKNNCAPMPTPQSTIDFFITGWKKSVSEAIDLACGQYSSLQSCEQRLPKATNVFKSLIPNDLPVGRQSTTFLTPMIRIAHKMDA